MLGSSGGGEVKRTVKCGHGRKRCRECREQAAPSRFVVVCGTGIAAPWDYGSSPGQGIPAQFAGGGYETYGRGYVWGRNGL